MAFLSDWDRNRHKTMAERAVGQRGKLWRWTCRSWDICNNKEWLHVLKELLFNASDLRCSKISASHQQMPHNGSASQAASAALHSPLAAVRGKEMQMVLFQSSAKKKRGCATKVGRNGRGETISCVISWVKMPFFFFFLEILTPNQFDVCYLQRWCGECVPFNSKGRRNKKTSFKQHISPHIVTFRL